MAVHFINDILACRSHLGLFQFRLRSCIEYLGYAVDEQGLHPAEEKVNVAPTPKDVPELRSFLYYIGIVNYHTCYMPNLFSTRLAPLYQLLHIDKKFH